MGEHLGDDEIGKNTLENCAMHLQLILSQNFQGKRHIVRSFNIQLKEYASLLG
jgi:hypothetical protein